MVTCRQCKHTKTRDSKECTNNNIDPKFMDTHKWDHNKLPKVCPYFEKDYSEGIDMIAECFNCGKEMTTNEEWFYIDGPLEKKPVCCPECVEKGQKKIDNQVEDIEEGIDNIDDFFEDSG